MLQQLVAYNRVAIRFSTPELNSVFCSPVSKQAHLMCPKTHEQHVQFLHTSPQLGTFRHRRKIAG